MFGATNIVNSGYRIAFDGAGLWSFGNDFAKNIVIFGVDNSPSSYTENHKNSFLVLGEGPTYDINWSFESPPKEININFSETKIKF